MVEKYVRKILSSTSPWHLAVMQLSLKEHCPRWTCMTNEIKIHNLGIAKFGTLSLAQFESLR